MASLGRTLLFRAVNLVLVLLGVLVLLAVIMGASGLSDRVLKSILDQSVREFQQQLIQRGYPTEQIASAVAAYNQSLAAQLGIDRPWYVRMPQIIWQLLTLNLGESRTLQTSWGSKRVADLVLERLPNTILLTTTATLVSALVGIWLGVWIGSRIGGRADRLISMMSGVSYALPLWFVSIVFIFLLAYTPMILWNVKLFPPGKMVDVPPPRDPLLYALNVLWHLSLPLLASFVVSFGGWAYTVRNIVFNISQEDYVAFARAKGLPEELVRRRYILRPAAPPILTNFIISLAGSLAGYIITETIFEWPGMGLLFYQAITSVDEPVIFALTYIYALVYIIARFILEVLYVVVDPRIRLA